MKSVGLCYYKINKIIGLGHGDQPTVFWDSGIQSSIFSSLRYGNIFEEFDCFEVFVGLIKCLLFLCIFVYKFVSLSIFFFFLEKLFSFRSFFFLCRSGHRGVFPERDFAFTYIKYLKVLPYGNSKLSLFLSILKIPKSDEDQLINSEFLEICFISLWQAD